MDIAWSEHFSKVLIHYIYLLNSWLFDQTQLSISSKVYSSSSAFFLICNGFLKKLGQVLLIAKRYLAEEIL